MDYKERIFRSVVADQMRADVKRLNGLEAYYGEASEYTDDQTWPLRVEVVGDKPVLSPDRNDDPINACLLHSYLAKLDETQASDKRLWTYMTHVTFRDYVQSRWPLPSTLEEVRGSSDAKKKVSDSIILHWFLNGNDSRTLKRHALARLWWAAHLTVAPWEQSEDFTKLQTEDRYIYTKFLLSNETLYTEVLERTLGNSRQILIALLEYFRRHPDKINRKFLRPIMKEMILMSGVKRLSLLNYDDVYKLVESISDEITSNPNL
jgi:hypothetical protein